MNKKKSLKKVLVLCLMAVLSIGGIIAKDRVFDKKQTGSETAVSGLERKAAEPKAMKMVPRLHADALSRTRTPGKRAWVSSKPSNVWGNITSEQSSKIYGGAIYADNWTTDYQPVGIYSFTPADGSSISPVMVGDDYVVTGGGFFANGKYYYVSYMSFMGFVLADLYTVNFETWEIERDLPIDIGAVAQDMAYDPTTGVVYGCFMNDEGDGWVFGYLDIETGKRTKLKDLDMVILSVGVSSKGDVYGVGLDGGFYQFDKKTGDRTLIGNTGKSPLYSASGCFDLSTDTFYWECIEADAKANIYTIDLTTGAATYVTTLANNVEMTGMFIPQADAADDAPAAVADLTIDFPEGELAGKITFTMPTKCFNASSQLSGNLEWYLSINDAEPLSGFATPGQKVSVDYTAAAPGMLRANVYTVNDAGRSPVANKSQWVGNDAPAAVGNLQVKQTATAGEFVVSWTAPEKSVNGGYMAPEKIKYDVVRMPENQKVADGISATSFTEKFDPQGDYALHYYVVTPVFEGISGLETESGCFASGSLPLPYLNRFDEEIDFAGFTVEDTNADSDTWTYDAVSQAARIKYNFQLTDNGVVINDMDDWLFTPAIRLQAGRMIRFALDSKAYMSGYSERFEVKLGKSPASGAMTDEVIGITTVTGTDYKTFEGYVSVEEDGLYFFGIHGCSPKDQLYLYADNITIEQGPVLGTPGAVSGLTAKAGANGSLEATLTFKAPSKSVDGKDIDKLDKIEIRRDNELIETLSNPTPGAELKYTDTNAKQGINNYSVKAYNSIGEGYETSVSIYVGHDRPGLPVNVVAHEEGGKVVISWRAPVEGETGGYFDPSALTYTVLRANDEKELAVGITDLSFTDVPPLYGEHHDFFTYYVYAQSPAGYGYGQASNSVCFGKTFSIPFAESFGKGGLLTGPWDVNIPEESYGWWKIAAEGTYPSAAPQDNDGGLVTFIPEEEGDTGELISGKISLAGSQYPALDFWWYCTPGSSDRIFVYINPDDEGKKLATRVDLGSGSKEGWTKTTVDLSDYKSAGFIQIALNAVSNGGYYNIHIDNIRVHETFDFDLEANAFSVPSRMMAGEKSYVNLEIVNNGINSLTDYTVELYRDGNLEQTLSPGRILKDEVKKVTFEVTPTPLWGDCAELYAVVNCALDENPDNDKTPVVETLITELNYPAVTDLKAVRDEMVVSLDWSEPELVSGSGEVNTEDVEDIKAFSIDNLGEWIVRDADMMPTYGIGDQYGNQLMYENAGAPMAFMAFNPSLAGIPVENQDGSPTEWAAHSGDQYFAAFACTDGQNDDWLISPLLPGIEQEISFWVKSLTSEYGYEKYEVYYSTSGIEKEDFRLIGDVRSAPIQWVEDKVTLPKGTRYFAIRCISNDCYVFMLDDIRFTTSDTYMGELSLLGYNVYRDLQLLTPQPIMEQTYVDNAAGKDAHTYNVTVVYDLGESRLSNDATVVSSGVGSVESGSLKVRSGQGWLEVDAPAQSAVAVYSADGVLIESYASDGMRRLSLPTGVYLIVADSHESVKVLVK